MKDALTIALSVALAASLGCHSAQRVANVANDGQRPPAKAEQQTEKNGETNSESESVDATKDRVADSEDELEPDVARSVEELVQLALQQNPAILAARHRVDQAAYQVPVAGSLDDPMLSVSVFTEEVQTAAGEQEFSVTTAQKFPWFGKRQTRSNVAAAEVLIARSKLAELESATIEQVKRAYYELFYVQQTIAVTREEQKLLGEIREIANVRYKTGKASQQDVLRADLEISAVESELIRLKQRLVSTQAQLARTLHVPPQTRLRALDELPAEEAPVNLEALQQQAIAARPELQTQLATLNRDRQAVDLVRLNKRPDVTLGSTWINISDEGLSRVANGRDAFLLTASINLPIYQNRIESQILSTQAKAAATAHEYDATRDETLSQVTDLFAQADSQRELLTLLREDILPKSRQTLEVSSRAYNVGEVDFLQLIDNWRQVLRYEVNQQRLEASLRQTLAQLERIVGGLGISSPSNEIINHPHLPKQREMRNSVD